MTKRILLVAPFLPSVLGSNLLGKSDQLNQYLAHRSMKHNCEARQASNPWTALLLSLLAGIYLACHQDLYTIDVYISQIYYMQYSSLSEYHFIYILQGDIYARPKKRKHRNKNGSRQESDDDILDEARSPHKSSLLDAM